MDISKLLAHSKRKTGKEQSYNDHVNGVVRETREILSSIRDWIDSSKFGAISTASERAAILHDVGKVVDGCQIVLQGNANKMVNHVDGGVAVAIHYGDILSAILVHAHHAGLADFMGISRINDFRDTRSVREYCDHYTGNETTKEYYDSRLEEMTPVAEFHGILLSQIQKITHNPQIIRLLLSILVSADHTDTAKHAGNRQPYSIVASNMAVRRKYLSDYISRLSETPRTDLRREMYAYSEKPVADWSMIDAGLGTGKTFFALNYAMGGNPRKIISVGPSIFLVEQYFRSYTAVTMPGESTNEVVSQLHHLVPYNDEYEKLMTYNLKTPFVVTTYNQFFSTLFGNRTRLIKRYYEFIGSHIIIDEHQLIPYKLWESIIRTLNDLVINYGCKVTFVSGTMIRPWDIGEIREKTPIYVENLVPAEFSDKVRKIENERVKVERDKVYSEYEELADEIFRYVGPKLTICNTKKRAARLAKTIASKYGRNKVEHLSTSLTMADRQSNLRKVEQNIKNDKDFVLVSTTLVESGVDLSFRYGWREQSGLFRIFQTTGRINRHSEYSNSEPRSFLRWFGLKVDDDPGSFTTEIRKTCDIWEKFNGEISSNSFQEFFEEMIEFDKENMRRLCKNNVNLKFCKVAKDAAVIEDNEYTIEDSIILIDKRHLNELPAEELKLNWIRANERTIEQLKSYIVRVESQVYENIYALKDPILYSNFLGIMDLILQI